MRAGDRIAIIGPNGVGKTTLLRIIMDQLKAVIQEITGFEEPAEATQSDAAKTEATSSEGN